jgi:hypothetical protein
MANTFNGIGTTFYGKRGYEQDDSYVTTKWFVIGFFPLVPLGSLRVRYIGTEGVPFLARTSSFEVVEELPTQWLQVLAIYAYAIFIVVWTTSLMTRDMSGIGRFLLIAAAIVLPHAVRFLMRKLQG